MKRFKTILSGFLSLAMLTCCIPVSGLISAEGADREYTVFMGNPSLLGAAETDVTAASDYLAASKQRVYSACNDDDGWYYTFSQDYKSGGSLYGGASHAKSGYSNNSKGTNYAGTEWSLGWIGKREVLGKLGGLIDASAEYRITQYGSEVSNIDLYINGTEEWGTTTEFLKAKVTEFEVWKTATGTLKEINNFYSGFLSFKAELGWNDTGKAAGDVTVVTDLRNIKLTVKESNREAVNAALEGTDYDFDKLIAPFLVDEEYADLENPDENSSDTGVIWYANPDRAGGAYGDDVTADKPSDSDLVYKTGYRTIKCYDEDGVYYRTTMSVSGGGGDGSSTIFKSGISYETNSSGAAQGFGWLDKRDVVDAISKYIYLGFQFRYDGAVPEGARLYVSGVNGYDRCWTTAAKITQSGNWSEYPLTALGLKDNRWYKTDVALNLYVWNQSFSGTQKIDIRDMRFELKASDRVYINKDLSKIKGIDDIPGFTKGVDIPTDVNGYKDYYSLLVGAAKGVRFDIDDDGEVTVKDLIRLKKYDSWMIYLPEMMIERADANADGAADAADIVEMRKAILGA